MDFFFVTCLSRCGLAGDEDDVEKSDDVCWLGTSEFG